ncbi:MAG TPA: aspartate/glutamate racemase family protein, partial [Methylotenera sp.]|nr:aspartate/glutamate racemase family protein [Methylotenera sp.]
ALIQQYCAPLLTEGADTIVLGCTHYPFVREAIRDIVGDSVTLIDTGAAVAKQLKRQLAESQLLTTKTQPADVMFWTNNDADNAAKIIEALWGKSASVGRI